MNSRRPFGWAKLRQLNGPARSGRVSTSTCTLSPGSRMPTLPSRTERCSPSPTTAASTSLRAVDTETRANASPTSTRSPSSSIGSALVLTHWYATLPGTPTSSVRGVARSRASGSASIWSSTSGINEPDTPSALARPFSTRGPESRGSIRTCHSSVSRSPACSSGSQRVIVSSPPAAIPAGHSQATSAMGRRSASRL